MGVKGRGGEECGFWIIRWDYYMDLDIKYIGLNASERRKRRMVFREQWRFVESRFE